MKRFSENKFFQGRKFQTVCVKQSVLTISHTVTMKPSRKRSGFCLSANLKLHVGQVQQFGPNSSRSQKYDICTVSVRDVLPSDKADVKPADIMQFF